MLFSISFGFWVYAISIYSNSYIHKYFSDYLYFSTLICHLFISSLKSVRRTKKENATKGPEKHANHWFCYGLLVDVEDSLRGADLWGVPQSRNPQQWTQGTGRNPKRVCQVVVHVERNKEPMELCHRTDSLKVHRCSGTHSCRKTRMKTKPPHVEQQQWVPESLKRVSSAAEPGADIGVKVNIMFTTDD